MLTCTSTHIRDCEHWTLLFDLIVIDVETDFKEFMLVELVIRSNCYVLALDWVEAIYQRVSSRSRISIPFSQNIQTIENSYCLWIQLQQLLTYWKHISLVSSALVAYFFFVHGILHLHVIEWFKLITNINYAYSTLADSVFRLLLFLHLLILNNHEIHDCFTCVHLFIYRHPQHIIQTDLFFESHGIPIWFNFIVSSILFAVAANWQF